MPDLKNILKLAEIFDQPVLEFLDSERSDDKLHDRGTTDDFPNYMVFEKGSITQNVKEHVSHGSDWPVVAGDRYPRFSSDLSEEEQYLVMCFRLMPADAQKELIDIMKDRIDKEKV